MPCRSGDEPSGAGVGAAGLHCRRRQPLLGRAAGGYDATRSTLPGHVILLVRAGIYILENLLLEELSERKADEFVLVCLPLKMKGVTGSPVRPIALLPPHADSR
jgi:kynurenine formamidase